jgi:ubiquitin C-terminal hydrolase
MQQNEIYKLYGACLHFGGLDGGHYTAICLNYKTNKWVDFNDSRLLF